MKLLDKRLGTYLGEKDDSKVIVTYGDISRILTLLRCNQISRAKEELENIQQYLDYTKE